MLKSTIILIALLGTSFHLFSQKSENPIVDFRISQSESSQIVTFDLKVKKGICKRQEFIRATPVIHDGSIARKLKPFVIGKKRTKGVERLKNNFAEMEDFQPTRYKDNRISYSYVLEESIEFFRPTLTIQLTKFGYRDTVTLEPYFTSHSHDAQTPKFIPEIYSIVPKLTWGEELSAKYCYVTHQTSNNKNDLFIPTERNSLPLYFDLKESILDYKYRRNNNHLRQLKMVLSQLGEAEESDVKKIIIWGYISPKDSLPENRMLAEKRMNAVKEFLMKECSIESRKIELVNKGKRWNDLYYIIQTSKIDGKDKLLQIIDTTPVENPPKERERLTRLQQVDQGKPYQYIQRHILPFLRNGVYIKIFYTDNNQDITVCDNINKGILAIENGTYENALEILAPYQNDLRTFYYIGICFLMMDENSQAKLFLTKAKKIGDIRAKKALDYLAKYRN